MSDALKVSSDVFFFKLGAQADAQGPDRSSSWARGSASAARPGSTCRRVRRPRARPQVARHGATSKYQRVRQEGQRHRRGRTAGAVQVRRHRAPVDAGRQRQPRRRPGRPAGRRRCSSPSPTRRSPTAARSSRRTSARPSRTATASPIQELPQAGRGARSSSPAPTARRSSTGCTRAASEDGGTSADVFKGFPLYRSTARPAPPSAAATPTRPGTPASSTHRDQADRRRRDRRARRLRRRDRGARGAPDPLAVVRS